MDKRMGGTDDGYEKTDFNFVLNNNIVVNS